MYETMRRIAALIEDERNLIANLANAAAVLGEDLDDINWAGFYLWDGSELVLGPFWGQPACIRIPLGKGVCGTALAEQRTIIVPDVHAFPGHIACDPHSRSEIVVPMLTPAGHRLGVIDIDSPFTSRFTDDDGRGLGEIAQLLIDGCDWPVHQ